MTTIGIETSKKTNRTAMDSLSTAFAFTGGRRHVENGSSFSVAVVGGRKVGCGF
jgi:hypothetical protein